MVRGQQWSPSGHHLQFDSSGRLGQHALTLTAPVKHQLAHHIVEMALGLVSGVTSCI